MVKTIYLGRGRAAEKAANEQDRRKRRLANIAAFKKLGAETFEQIELLLRAGLVAAGFYLRHGGPWRIRKYSMPKELHPFQAPPPSPTTLTGLVEKANLGDEKALAGLREYLRTNPHVWLKAGDVASHAREARICKIAAGNNLVAESIRLKLEALREELAGPRANLMEKLAIEGVLQGWLEVNQMQLAGLADVNQPYQSRFVALEKTDRKSVV